MKEIVLEGGCHCGAIRYRIEGPPPESGYCHCRDCQQTSGSPAQVWMDVRSGPHKIWIIQAADVWEDKIRFINTREE